MYLEKKEVIRLNFEPVFTLHPGDGKHRLDRYGIFPGVVWKDWPDGSGRGLGLLGHIRDGSGVAQPHFYHLDEKILEQLVSPAKILSEEQVSVAKGLGGEPRTVLISLESEFFFELMRVLRV